MRIVFFGSSHGFPEAGRRCSSILLQVGENNYFIDMGTQSIEQLADRGIRPETIKACFVTHMHGDHTNGLISFIDLCSWYYTKTNTEFYFPGDTDRFVSAIKEWLSCLGHNMSDLLKFSHVDDGFVYDDGVIKLTAYRTAHIAESFSYVLEAEGKRVYFSGDVASPAAPALNGDALGDLPLAEFDRGFDLAILELAHFWAPDKYYPLLKDRDNIKQVCINHYSTYIRQFSAYDLMKLLPEQKIVFANDGMEFNI